MYLLYLYLHKMSGQNHRSERRIWSLNRPQYMFEENLLNRTPDLGCWRNNFRMEKTTFLKICQLAEPFLKPSNRCIRDPVYLEKRVAICLAWLANGCTYLAVANMFGVHKSTAFKFIQMFLEGMFALRSIFIKLPSSNRTYLSFFFALH